MEKNKKQRSPIRTMITRTINESEAELAKEQIHILTIKGKYEKINSLLQQLQMLDQQVLDKLLDDEDMDDNIYVTEMETIQEYVDKAVLIKLKIDDIVCRSEQTNRAPSESATSV